MNNPSVTFEAQIDEQDQSTFRSNPDAIGVQIARRDQRNPHQPAIKVSLKALMRDGREHIFVNLSGRNPLESRNLLTLVLEEDGTVAEHHDIPG